jgi:hypothetical protein
MTELQTLSIVIGVLTTCVSVVIGVISIVTSNRRADQQRQTELFMNIYDRFQDKEYTKTMYRIIVEYQYADFDEFSQKYGFDMRTRTYSNLDIYAEAS